MKVMAVADDGSNILNGADSAQEGNDIDDL